jgi:thymidylate synthase
MFGIQNEVRGQKTTECSNFSCDLLPSQRLLNHNELPLNWDYLKTELKWYANGDYYDESIAEHASQWDKVRNPDGFWVSNYGYWLWGPPQRLKWVIEELYRSPSSRRAVVHINSPEHLRADANDVPCTMYFNFHIRVEQLYMTVHMRSQDAVWGLRNDLPFFWMVFDVMAKILQLRQGYMHYSVDSLHVYDRHYKKVKACLADPGGWQDSVLNTSALVDKIINEKLCITPRKVLIDEPRPVVSEEPRDDGHGFSSGPTIDMFET